MRRGWCVCLLVLVWFAVFSCVLQAKVTLEVWTQPGSSREGVEKLVPSFRQKYPYVDVSVSEFEWQSLNDKLLVGLASGKVPDISQIEVTFLGGIRDQGASLLEDLAAAPYGMAQYKAEILPHKWAQASTLDGRLIGLPLDLSPSVMFYRRSHFANAGFSETPQGVRELTSTWDKFAALGRKLTYDSDGDGNNDRFLLGDARQIFDIGSKQTGLPTVDANNQVHVDSRPWIGILTKALEFRTAGYDGTELIQWTWHDNWKGAITNGQLATEFMGSWFASTLEKEWAPAAKGDWGITLLPTGVGVEGGGSFYAIPSAAANKNEASLFLEHVLRASEPNIGSYRGHWVWSVLDKPNEYFGGQSINRVFAEAAAATPILWVHGLQREIAKVVYEDAWRPMSKQMTPEAYLTDKATVLRGMVKEYEAGLKARTK